ncbi:mechanosensitive ion channel family protein [Candidatus Halocynthiibacter alkanivorans]|uniref:mechanosensitive ion channel family protein n=1 Tax=Candidatus Halocynthiibacter alkanivorans TaxID=2267619 RepID=UPI000DF21690|nr:mechanosensitive ion channel domain-containing protein [Candidatus Halocynthiibacter alkanivorans]
MEDQLSAIPQQITTLWMAVQTAFSNLYLPSRINQFVILVLCFVAAWILRRWAAPQLSEWAHGLEGVTKWRLRLFLVLHNRMQLITFTALSWFSVAVMAQLSTYPSRRYILALFASIAFAWLSVTLATRLIRNRPLRRIVKIGLLIWVTLYYLRLDDDFTTFLQASALEIGDSRLSLYGILKALVVTALLISLARLATASAARSIDANRDISPSMQVLAVKLLQVLLYSTAFFIGLKAVGFDLTGLAVLSGAIGLGLGFGLQKVVSNLVSGVIILLDKSIKPGDVISLGETFGWIKTLGARYASVVTRDGREFLIPNEDLITNQVVNWSFTNDYVRLDITFGTAYDDDPHLVRRIAVEAARSVPRVSNDRPAVCHITGFGDSSVDYVLRFWITDPTSGLTNVRGLVYLALWDAFKAAGISIPFPQRELRMLKNDDISPPDSGN